MDLESFGKKKKKKKRQGIDVQEEEEEKESGEISYSFYLIKFASQLKIILIYINIFQLRRILG